MINIDIGATVIAILTLFGIYALMALSLNLEYGVAGVPNFGQALFVSVGAYVAGITYTRLLPLLAGQGSIHPCGPSMGAALQLRSEIMAAQPVAGFINLGLTFVIAAVLAGALGFAVAYVTLRLKEEWFLALVLLVGGETLRILVRGADDLICSHNGISGLAQPFYFVDDPRASALLFMLLALCLALAAYVYCQRLLHSPFGRMLKGLRENEEVTRGLGKGISLARAQIMLIGSVMAAVGGALFALNTGFVNANDYVVTLTVDIWVMVVLGGIGNNRGALLGALLIAVLDRGTQIGAIALNMSGSPIEFNYVRHIAFGLILLLMLRYRPTGLLPEPRLTTKAHAVAKGFVPQPLVPGSTKPEARTLEPSPSPGPLPQGIGEGERRASKLPNLSAPGQESLGKPQDPPDASDTPAIAMEGPTGVAPLLRIENMRKDYGGLRALDGVSLDVPEGAIIGLIGPNGSGKSTLLNLVAGAQTMKAGRIFFAGEDISDAPADAAYQRGIARGYQEPALFNKLTALDNLLLPVKDQRGEQPWRAPWHGSWQAQETAAAERAYDVLRRLQLERHYDTLAADLSGGQMKLLEIGRALMGEPKLLLLDEPTAGVAPKLAYEIFQRIAGLRDERGMAFLIVEHRLEILFDFVDYVYVLHLGKMLASGAPADIAADATVREVYFGD